MLRVAMEIGQGLEATFRMSSAAFSGTGARLANLSLGCKPGSDGLLALASNLGPRARVAAASKPSWTSEQADAALLQTYEMLRQAASVGVERGQNLDASDLLC